MTSTGKAFEGAPERDLSDIVRERKENHPEEWRRVTHTCGHQGEWWVGSTFLGPDEQWFILDSEEELRAEADQPCLSCRPCPDCQQQRCVCPRVDPFADEE